MKYDLFLFDLDDTLLDFKASERLSFERALAALAIISDDSMFSSYQMENRRLWQLFEEGRTTKDELKVERFRRTFALHNIDADAEMASDRYLACLPETVVLIDHSVELLQWLSGHGEIGIITNGIHVTQTLRIQNSPLAPYISFVSVSEDCGFAKPDPRFFEYASKMAKNFRKERALVIGDRWEADIVGASRFGLDSVWFNPERKELPGKPSPTYEIRELKELRKILT